MKCKNCNKTIKKGSDFFQDPDYKTKQYCNEKCYKDNKKKKKNKKEANPKPKPKPSSYRVLTDYVQSVWPIEPNWPWFATQVKSLKDETGLDDEEIRLTIKYCVEYLGKQPDPQFGIQQFVPKYTQEAMNFAEEIMKVKQFCKEHEDDKDEVIYIKPSSNKLKILKEDVSF